MNHKRTIKMLLTTLNAVAQQESENISEQIKLGLQMKMKNLIKYFEMA